MNCFYFGTVLVELGFVVYFKLPLSRVNLNSENSPDLLEMHNDILVFESFIKASSRVSNGWSTLLRMHLSVLFIRFLVTI